MCGEITFEVLPPGNYFTRAGSRKLLISFAEKSSSAHQIFSTRKNLVALKRALSGPTKAVVSGVPNQMIFQRSTRR